MTVLLDKEAFRFFTPKDLHVHLRQFDSFLAQRMQKDANVRQLLDQPLAVFSAETFFPIIHITALFKDGQWHYFFPPHEHYKRLDGHRLVSQDGNQNAPGMMPLLRLEVVSDPHLTAVFNRETAMKILAHKDRWQESDELSAYTDLSKSTEKPAVIFTAPLAFMMKKLAQRFLRQRFTLYQHILGAGHEYPDDGLFYIGITARDWKKRWSEHKAAILRGSSLKFHRAYRERVLARQLTYVHHKIMGVAPTLDDIRSLEEAFVAGHWDDKRLLNMIPGGKAGIAYLHEHGIMARNVNPTPDTVERVLEDWLREHPRKGLPAPWVAEKWKDDSYALSVICGPEGRLSIEQVVTIRTMAAGGVALDDIAQRVGAKNRLQVQRVVEGKTYGRVKDG